MKTRKDRKILWEKGKKAGYQFTTILSFTTIFSKILFSSGSFRDG